MYMYYNRGRIKAHRLVASRQSWGGGGGRRGIPICSSLPHDKALPNQHPHLLKQAEEHIGVNGPLVCLIQHDDGVRLHVSVYEQFPQQHAVRHVLDDRVLARHILKPAANQISRSTGERRSGGYPCRNVEQHLIICLWVQNSTNHHRKSSLDLIKQTMLETH